MADPNDIPHLIKLLDDPSDTVRAALAEEFVAFGSKLEPLMDGLPEPPDVLQRQDIQNLVADYHRDWLLRMWPDWYAMEGFAEKIETALGLLARYMNGTGYEVSLGRLLDKLAGEFLRTEAPLDGRALAEFLFEEKGYTGAKETYYDPKNSNMLYVLEMKRGIPITLAALYILVGHRLGISIQGCNWPGHFMARVIVDGEPMLVDGFNGGMCVTEEGFLAMQGPSLEAARHVLAQELTAEAFMARVLTNLVRAYEEGEHFANRQLMVTLLKDVQNELRKET